MCLCHIRVRDYLNRPRYYDNYFNCGRCPACLQQKADRRARRIQAHHPKGTKCYFITLTYSNEYVPYIDPRDIECFCGPQSVPVYRDRHIRYFKQRTHIYEGTLPVGSLEFDFDVHPYDVSGLSFIRKKCRNKDGFYFKKIPNKVSVSFTYDVQCFFKRLRQNLFRHFGEDQNITYYYAPEYGPDSSRYHIHLLVWFPANYEHWFIASSVLKAWPYGDPIRTYEYIQPEKCASHYVASYINCSTNVSEFLRKIAPLRPTHSVSFGFDDERFSFVNVLASAQRRCFTFHYEYTSKNGKVISGDAPFPSYIINTYFPRFKGYNRITRDEILIALEYPENKFKQGSLLGYTPKGVAIYSTRLKFRNYSIGMTQSDCDYALFRIIRCYNTYYRSNGYSPVEFANIVYSFWVSYYSYLYKQSLLKDEEYSFLRFNNLSDVRSGVVKNDSISDCISSFTDYQIDPDTNFINLYDNKKLVEKFNDNIKTRHVNAFSSV